MSLTNNKPISEIIRFKPERLTEKEIREFWYDWFCSDKALYEKGIALLKKLQKVYDANEASGRKHFDPDKTYVWFKNNCPMVGKLYDDFRIADIETDETLITIVPTTGHDSQRIKGEFAGVYSEKSDWENHLKPGSQDWMGVIAFFNGIE